MSMTPPRARGPTEPCLDLRPLFIESGPQGRRAPSWADLWVRHPLDASQPGLAAFTAEVGGHLRRRDGEHAERRMVEGRAQLGLRDAARAALAQLAFAETQHVVVAAERERRSQRRHEAAALAVVEGVEQTGVDDRER